MYGRLNIRQRILVIFISVALTGGFVQFLIAGNQLQAATLEFHQHHLETDAVLTSASLSEPLEKYLEGEGSSALGRILTTLNRTGSYNYLVVDRQYKVISSTPGAGYGEVDFVQQTPELTIARIERIGADVRPNPRGEDALYVAVSILYENSLVGYLVLSQTMQAAYAEVRQHYLELAAGSIPVIGLVIAASLWVSGTISRPIQHLRNSAMILASGALDTRIQATSQDELGQLAESFNYMAGQLEALMQTQRSFVSNAAHELRTPLMTLKLRAEALSDDTLPASERETYLSEIRREVDHMAELVSSLLMLARADEGRHQASGTVTDTVAMLHDITRHWRIEAESKGLQFAAEVTPNLPDLPMSPNDFRVVLDNLLSNAIKYTPQGTVRLKVSQQDGAFAIEVCDTGVGFPPEQDKHLFERFFRSEQVRGTIAGTGLGLSVVQVILQHYDGCVEAHSQGLGKGAVFTVRLAARPPAA
jgi:signal transduction histidine kinase